MIMLSLERDINLPLRNIIALGVVREEFYSHFLNLITTKVPGNIDPRRVGANFIDAVNCVIMNTVLQHINRSNTMDLVNRLQCNSFDKAIEITDFEVQQLLEADDYTMEHIDCGGVINSLEFYFGHMYRSDCDSYNKEIFKLTDNLNQNLTRFKGKLIRSSLINRDTPLVFISGDNNDYFPTY